jgi:hypothetical protein
MKSDQDKTKKKTILKGPSLGFADNLPRRQVWKEIADEYNGEFKIKHTPGGDLEMHYISIPHKNWKIEISISDSRPLKFQMSFVPSLDFSFTISPEDFTDKILKVFRKPTIEIGWKEFDRNYMIKTNRSDLVKRIFTDDIQKTMLRHKVYSVSYQSSTNTRTAKLMSLIQRHAGDKAMMIELTDMFRSLIDKLEKYKVIHKQ